MDSNNNNNWNEDTDSEYDDEYTENEVPPPAINQEFIDNILEVKHKLYDNQAKEFNLEFISFSMTTFGAFGKEALNLLSILEIEEKENNLAFRARITLNSVLVRGNADLINNAIKNNYTSNNNNNISINNNI